MSSACIPHVLGMYIRKGCRRVADQTPKASWSIPKRCGRRRRLRIGPEGFPKACGWRWRAAEGLPKGSRMLAEHPKPSRSKNSSPNFKTVKSSMPKVFRSRVGPEGFQMGCGRVPDHLEGMPKVCRRWWIRNFCLREPFGVLVETGL